MESGHEVSWMAISPDARITGKDGKSLGKIEAVLGDDEDGIFHGIAINLPGLGGHVEVPAAKVTRITTDEVFVDVGEDEVDSLEKFKADRWFEFEGRGRFLKRIKWGKDD
jgi:PRC-barrel domain